MKELISVVVLTYNSSNTVVETLESIKNQSYPNLEIVVTDDASKDNTVHIVQKWFVENNISPNIVLSKVNTGIAANANRGIRKSQGNYIKLIAGDDLLEQDAIECFYKNLKVVDENILLQSNVKCFGINVDKCKEFERNLQDNEYFYKLSNDKQYEALLCSNYIVAPAIGLYRREIFESIGYFDESIPLLEDYPFNLKVVKNGFVFKKINENLVKYRLSENSITGTASKKYYDCLFKCFFKYRMIPLLRLGKLTTVFKELIKYCFYVVNLRISRVNNEISLDRIR